MFGDGQVRPKPAEEIPAGFLLLRRASMRARSIAAR
jgi:hypothetical protein